MTTQEQFNEFSQLETLKKFYNVDTLEGLIEAQANHIERLQEKIKIDMHVRMPNPRAF